jgi:beta-galactosidase
MELRWGNMPARAKVLRTTADLHLSWDVPYEPGTLKAVGIKDGSVASMIEVRTTGEPAAISLLVDRKAISADGRDVAHITGQILDSAGMIVPTANNAITFELEGDGQLIGVDNGDPSSHDSFQSDSRRAFHGLCLAIVRSTPNAGQIRLRAASPLLAAASVVVTTKG